MKKKVKKERPQDQVASQELVERYSALIHKHGRDWHIHKPKLLKKENIDPKDLTDHVIRRADQHFDLEMRRLTREWNVSPERKKDGFIVVLNGSDCLEPGDHLGYVIPKKDPKLNEGKVLGAMTNKWQTSDRVVKVTGLDKPKVLKALKLLVKDGKVEKRKKEDGTFQYRMKEVVA